MTTEDEKNPDCIDCKVELKVFIEYQYGHKSADGYECPKCSRYYEFGEI